MGVSSPDFHLMAIHTNAGFRNDYYPLLDAQNDWQKSMHLNFYWRELPYKPFSKWPNFKELELWQNTPEVTILITPCCLVWHQPLTLNFSNYSVGARGWEKPQDYDSTSSRCIGVLEESPWTTQRCLRACVCFPPRWRVLGERRKSASAGEGK